MTLGNMRANGVRTLAAWCFGRGCKQPSGSRRERLEEGVAVTYDVAADFAVLCANCHRMIHRSDDPSNLALFRGNLPSNKV
jgi:hypothetical protein